MKVIDVSAWQEYIDWKAVKNAGVEGVILKLGEYYTLDEKFVEHVNNAVANGLRYGVYYYGHASSINEAITEANWVDKQIKEYLNGKNPELGIWYDAEDKDMLEGSLNVVFPIANFVSTLLEKGYNYVGLYSSYNWLTNVIDMSCLPKYVNIWVAQYHIENSFALEHPERICRMWQYTDCERIGDMNVDCNIYYEKYTPKF